MIKFFLRIGEVFGKKSILFYNKVILMMFEEFFLDDERLFLEDDMLFWLWQINKFYIIEIDVEMLIKIERLFLEIQRVEILLKLIEEILVKVGDLSEEGRIVLILQ